MKLYVKQKMLSWNAHFTVRDEHEIDRLSVEGESFSFGRKLHIYDAYGREVAFVQQKVFSFTPRFFVYTEGVKIAEIVKEFTVMKPKYRIEGLGWEISGDFWAHQYSIMNNGIPIVSVTKEWLTWGDSYALDITHPEDTIAALAVVLAIDCVSAQQAVTATAN